METTATAITSGSVLSKIAGHIQSFRFDKARMITDVIKEIFDAKLRKPVTSGKMDTVNDMDSVLVGYNAKRGVWVIAAYNRVCRACRGYIYNPLEGDRDIKDLHMCILSFRSLVMRLEDYRMKYRVFTREEAGEHILKCIFGGYYNLGT